MTDYTALSSPILFFTVPKIVLFSVVGVWLCVLFVYLAGFVVSAGMRKYK